MDLLKDYWIPAHNSSNGQVKKLNLQKLLCTEGQYTLSLPRDDLEFAALQLLICLVQVLFPPNDKKNLENRIRSPMTETEFSSVIQNCADWFRVDHPDYPFMQVKGVKAQHPTSLDKLLAGLDTATNSRFVNEPGLAEKVCSGCAAIALYNQANNAPSFGGGFKFGLRGTCPASTLIQSTKGFNDLRATIWFNILTWDTINSEFNPLDSKADNEPTWVEPISNDRPILASRIGLLRGLFWQPAHVELCKASEGGKCSLCGDVENELYHGFNKAKFNYTVEGLWPHPHSPQLLLSKKGQIIEKFFGYTTSAPVWTQLSRFLVERELEEGRMEGHRPAAVLRQSRHYWRHLQKNLVLIAGGYRNSQASILERRHDTIVINAGWQDNTEIVHDLVQLGLGFRTALDASLKTFSGGIKGKDRKTKGLSFDVYKIGEKRFYRQSEALMLEGFAGIDFDSPGPTFDKLRLELANTCRDIFDTLTEPYIHEPELLRTRAIARRVLEKRIKELTT
jgi:CRISPR system Cascade subunit CasA